jgi:hypothetical protein
LVIYLASVSNHNQGGSPMPSFKTAIGILGVLVMGGEAYITSRDA